MTEEPRLTLSSIAVASGGVDAGESQGAVRYRVNFNLTWACNQISLEVHVETREGWETARHLACEEVKKMAAWLGDAAEHEKTGPHIHKLF